jgi:SNF2 family DNA or RNA helicase
LTATDAGAEARWGVSLTLPDDAERVKRLTLAFPPAGHAVPITEAAGPGRPGASDVRPRIWPVQDLLLEFLDSVADLLARGDVASGAAPGLRSAAAAAPPERWERRLVNALTKPDAGAVFLEEGVLERGLIESLVRWAEPSRGAPGARGPRLCLKLDPPPVEERPDPARAKETWRLGYFLQAPDDPSLLLPARDIWRASGTPTGWMDRTYGEPQDVLLRELARAGRVFRPIERSLDSPKPEGSRFDTPGAWEFLSQAALILGETGFGLVLPSELSPSGQRRLRLRMRVGGSGPSAAGLVEGRGLSLDAMLEFRWEAAIGDHTLDRKEFARLIALKRPLVQWRGQWVVLDPREIREVSRLLGEGGGRLSTRDALQAALGETMPREGSRPPVDIVAEGPLASLVDRLRDRADPLLPPEDLVGELRPYQARGLGWLGTLAAVGLGGCLADDMGLGKTVQTIAFLLARRQAQPEDGRPALVVCPMSVVGNWERELARFGPTLPVLRHHGAGRFRTSDALAEAPPHAVVVTTYGTLRRDRAVLRDVNWAVAILDEAQNIKNSAAQQAIAARALRASHRFTLTGTPVENRLTELWSILEFCVPGYLGPLEAFRRRYAVPIERYRDEGAAERLRRLVRPFVLRRLKSDPTIAADLPPKQEMSVVCTLTREQATLYQATTEEVMAKIERSEGIERRGLVLALITALKQICNHPAQYLHQRGPLPGRSGKLARVTEMLEEMLSTGDRVLVFTQFKEMGDRLVAHLQHTLGTEVPFLHGGVTRAHRDEMVRRFQEDPQAPPIFVLSLRAGGTGLNLMRATRVVHYDRWWNPAVEDQATDRAHRIGQDRVVQVHRLLAAGTIEEKIDRMLEDKRALADRIVGAGETWITEMPDAELRELVALSSDAAIGEDAD